MARKQEFGFQDWVATEGQEFDFVGMDGGEGAKSTWDVQAKIAARHGGTRYARVPPARRGAHGMGRIVTAPRAARPSLLGMALLGAGTMFLLHSVTKKGR